MMKRNLLYLLILGLFVLPAACSSEPKPDEPIYDEPEEYIRVGKQHLARKQFPMATRKFRLALELDRDNYRATLYAANSLGYWALGLHQRPNNKNPRKKDKRVRNLIKQSSEMFAKAHKLKPNNPVPYKEWGKMLFELKSYNPKFLKIAKTKLKQGAKLAAERDLPLIEAKCYFYLGATSFAQEARKEKKSPDFSTTRNYLFKYLNKYRNAGKTPPKEKEVEQFLMDIEERSGG